MKGQCSNQPTRFCVIVADDEPPDQEVQGSIISADVSFPPGAAAMRMGFLRQTSLRARRIASPANVLVCARERDRNVWESPLWFTRPGNRFISDEGLPTSLSIAAAVLSLAARWPYCLVTILPCDFWVARESVLAEAIESALRSLQRIPERVATLGMIDTHAGSDEDYLVVGPDNSYMGAVIQATANRPAPSIAKQLLKEGALVASGILLGYAQAFAAHIYKHWPQLALQMYERPESIAAPECEHRLATNAYKQLPNSVFSSIRLSPPTFPMRAFRVYGSGWCSRRSPPTIVRIRTPVQRAITYRPDLAATDYTS